MNNNKINWFPGHMKKAIDELKKKNKIIDLFLEVIDARIPLSSMDSFTKEVINNKPRIIIINKSDLADSNVTKRWSIFFEKNNLEFIITTTKSNNIKKIIIDKIYQILEEKIKIKKSKGIINYAINIAVLGIPNVGKSTIINKLVGKNKTKMANIPGVTKSQQLIKVSKDIFLLDTPGILIPNLTNQDIAMKLALTNNIKINSIDREEIVYKGLFYLLNNYSGMLEKKYNILINKSDFKVYDPNIIFNNIILKIKTNNIDNVINKFFYDMILSKIGKISWEIPSDEMQSRFKIL